MATTVPSNPTSILLAGGSSRSLVNEISCRSKTASVAAAAESRCASCSSRFSHHSIWFMSVMDELTVIAREVEPLRLLLTVIV
jgi:hypothetical protein